MTRFDGHEIAGHGYVVDLQGAVLSDLSSRTVAPLRDEDEPTVSRSRLTPPVEVEGRRYRDAIQFTRAVDRRQLGPRVASLADREWDIEAALDLVVSGF